jgi:hypothetical protein
LFWSMETCFIHLTITVTFIGSDASDQAVSLCWREVWLPPSQPSSLRSSGTGLEHFIWKHNQLWLLGTHVHHGRIRSWLTLKNVLSSCSSPAIYL